LDEDKERISTQQRGRDFMTMSTHAQLAPSNSGYRFGNHPMTMGGVRPEVPFKDATSTWRPPSADPTGPSSRKDREQVGSPVWHESHRMRTSMSSPALSATNMTVPLATHPLSREIGRWEKLSQKTEAREMTTTGGEVVQQGSTRKAPPKPQISRPPGGLVNFPKYMLIHSCHLKQMEQQRFQREQEERRRAFESMSEEERATGPWVQRRQDVGESAVEYATASWGAPLLGKRGQHWAGHGLAAGRNQRTSNPFRMG